VALSLSAEPYGALENDDWRDLSACRDTSPDLFFPVGTSDDSDDGMLPAERAEELVRIEPAG
jgi:hypothetical protein